MVNYPLKITHNGEEVLTLRKDEVKRKTNGKYVLDIGDAFERMLWEKSNSELGEIRSEILNKPEKTSHGLLFLVKTIDKILEQRRFIIDNQALRYALIP